MDTLILCIETSSTACSVSVCNKTEILSYREENNGYTHAEKLHVFIQDTVKEADIIASQLHAVAIGKGPGSYTGLRIGVSAAKGLSYALNIPLLAVNSLYNMAAQVKAIGDAENSLLCPMMDARRMEVYTSLYNGNNLEEIEPTSALILSEETVKKFLAEKEIVFFGDGMAKARELLSTIPGSRFIHNIFPSSLFMAEKALDLYLKKDFEDTAYFEPFYLKEFFTGAKPV